MLRVGSGWSAPTAMATPGCLRTTTSASHGRSLSSVPVLAGVNIHGKSGASNSIAANSSGSTSLAKRGGSVRTMPRGSTPITSPGP